jgi:hypothetical protein
VEGPRTKQRLDTDGITLCALSACIVVAAFRAEIPLELPYFSEFLVSQLARRLSPHEVGDALEPPQFSEFLVSELARLLPPPELGEALGLAETTHVSICRMPKTTSALTCCSTYTSTCCFFMAPGASVQSIESPACELTDASHLSCLASLVTRSRASLSLFKSIGGMPLALAMAGAISMRRSFKKLA